MTGIFSRPRGAILGRFKRSQGGATAVEFALVAAPFLYLLMAIFETGLMLFSEYVIENGVAKAARESAPARSSPPRPRRPTSRPWCAAISPAS